MALRTALLFDIVMIGRDTWAAAVLLFCGAGLSVCEYPEELWLLGGFGCLVIGAVKDVCAMDSSRVRLLVRFFRGLDQGFEFNMRV